MVPAPFLSLLFLFVLPLLLSSVSCDSIRRSSFPSTIPRSDRASATVQVNTDGPRSLFVFLMNDQTYEWLEAERVDLPGAQSASIPVTIPLVTVPMFGASFQWFAELRDGSTKTAHVNVPARVEAFDPSQALRAGQWTPPEDFDLFWADEFDSIGRSVPSARGGFIDGRPAEYPNPNFWRIACRENIPHEVMETLTANLRNAFVQDGKLKIRAYDESSSFPEMQRDGKPFITSARLESENLVAARYGIYAAKVRVPWTPGSWPAFWLVGSSWRDDNGEWAYWPTTGEIDIFEILGGDPPGLVRSALHWNAATTTNRGSRHKSMGVNWQTPDGSPLSAAEYIYWADYNQTHITFGIENYIVRSIPTGRFANSINPVRPFTGGNLMSFILNIAVGAPKSWSGTVNEQTQWPMEMVVDWVRLYVKKGSDTTELLKSDGLAKSRFNPNRCPKFPDKMGVETRQFRDLVQQNTGQADPTAPLSNSDVESKNTPSPSKQQKRKKLKSKSSHKKPKSSFFN